LEAKDKGSSTDTRTPTIEEVTKAAAQSAFRSPIIQNNLRSVVVEAILDLALSPEWRHCSQNWNGWDFEHATGTRLEVKQTAFKQSWAPPASPSEPRFDIAPRTGYWNQGLEWIAKEGRHADVYVFAVHPVTDERADHRDACQWRFHVVAAANLPDARSIGIAPLRALSPELKWTDLREAVDAIRSGLRSQQV
jgi:hypothetical protein